MAVPKYDELTLPFLQVLSDKLPKSNKMVLQEIIKKLKLTEDDCNLSLPNKTEPLLNYRLRWAKTYLKEAGLISYIERGISVITKEGLNTLNEKPKKIDKNYLKKFKSFCDFISSNNSRKKAQVVEDDSTNDAPEVIIYNNANILNKALAGALIDKIYKNDFKFFEKLVVKLLCKMGYGGSEEDIIQGMGRPHDNGIDGIIKQDPLGFSKIYIQAKRWKKNVSTPEVHKFSGALQGKHANKGILITVSDFPQNAYDYVEKLNDTIILINGKKLTQLMIDYNVAVFTDDVVEIKRLDEDFFTV